MPHGQLVVLPLRPRRRRFSVRTPDFIGVEADYVLQTTRQPCMATPASSWVLKPLVLAGLAHAVLLLASALEIGVPGRACGHAQAAPTDNDGAGHEQPMRRW